MRAAARAVRPCHTRSSAAQRFRKPVPPPTHALARMRHHSNGRLRQSLRNVHRMGSSSVAYRHTTRGRARERRRRMMTIGRLGQRRACWHGGKVECGGGGRCPSDRRLWVRRGGSRVPRRADGTDGYVCQSVGSVFRTKGMKGRCRKEKRSHTRGMVPVGGSTAPHVRFRALEAMNEGCWAGKLRAGLCLAVLQGDDSSPFLGLVAGPSLAPPPTSTASSSLAAALATALEGPTPLPPQAWLNVATLLRTLRVNWWIRRWWEARRQPARPAIKSCRWCASVLRASLRSPSFLRAQWRSLAASCTERCTAELGLLIGTFAALEEGEERQAFVDAARPLAQTSRTADRIRALLVLSRGFHTPGFGGHAHMAKGC